VYAFDADSNAGSNSTPLWTTSFIDPGAGVTTFSAPADTNGCEQIVPEIGITGTPVIDIGSGTLYVVSMTKDTSGGAPSFAARLHALDITTGGEKQGSPVLVQATVPGTGDGGAQVVFQPKLYKQRPGLLLLNGVVYAGFSSHCDLGQYHGWVMGYDAKSLQQVTVYNVTPNGWGASFWAGGAAPAADTAGNVYLVSGNGTFDRATGGPDLGESYIKLSSANGLSVTDYFTPFNVQEMDDKDTDTGSAGVALLPDEAGSTAHPHLMTGAGKEGRIYLLDRDHMGGFNAGADSQIVQSIPDAVDALFGNPAYFNHTVYFCGADAYMNAYSINNAQMSTTPSSVSPNRYGFPGCVPSISANGSSNGIVWVLDGSAYPTAVLRAYDASNIGNQLYTSTQNPARDALGSYVKFTAPMVANGKVYAGTQNSLAIYGLLSAPAGILIGNAASGGTAGVAPGSLISIYGSNLTTGTAENTSFPLPMQLAGLSVKVNGIPGPLLYASPGQINAQVPYEASLGPTTVTVSAGGSAVASGQVNVQAAAPGLFVLSGGHAAVLNEDSSVNAPGQPAAAGTVISAFLTGLGAVKPPVQTGAQVSISPLSTVSTAVTATIGGSSAQVQFAGLAPGFVGLYQVNVVVSQMAPGDYPLAISVGGVTSNSAPISVK
jgi:uncharacterized protein (TIGR03437 family)